MLKNECVKQCDKECINKDNEDEDVEIVVGNWKDDNVILRRILRIVTIEKNRLLYMDSYKR